MRKVLADISSETSKGKTISSVLANYKKDFDSVFLTMIKAGEQSGTLEEAFNYLSEQLAASYDLNQKVKGALMYPAVIIVAMIGEGILMFVFVLPKISDVFLKMDIDLPTYTRIIFGIGTFTDKYTGLVIGSIIASAIIAFLIVYLKTTRNILIGLIAKIPVVKKIFDQIDIARFSRTLSTLLKSGVSIMESLDVAVGSMGQEKMKRMGRKFSEGVGKGQNLSDILMESKSIFPAVVVQTIRAGEKTGNLEDVLLDMADFYEKEVDHSLKRLTSLLEPILMMAIGIAVGVMVIVMMAPIYSIMGNLQEAAQ
jgi:type IV pilus assembly protein PilC